MMDEEKWIVGRYYRSNQWGVIYWLHSSNSAASHHKILITFSGICHRTGLLSSFAIVRIYSSWDIVYSTRLIGQCICLLWIICIHIFIRHSRVMHDIRCFHDHRMIHHHRFVAVRIRGSIFSGHMTSHVRKLTTRVLSLIAFFASASRCTHTFSKNDRGVVFTNFGVYFFVGWLG